MGIGISIVIGAAGAIMRYAVTATAQGFDVHTAGVILMFVGALGLALSLLFWSSFAPFGRGRSTTRREEVISRNGEEQGSRVVKETHDVAN